MSTLKLLSFVEVMSHGDDSRAEGFSPFREVRRQVERCVALNYNTDKDRKRITGKSSDIIVVALLRKCLHFMQHFM